jgi:hypothetical protein
MKRGREEYTNTTIRISDLQLSIQKKYTQRKQPDERNCANMILQKEGNGELFTLHVKQVTRAQTSRCYIQASRHQFRPVIADRHAGKSANTYSL